VDAGGNRLLQSIGWGHAYKCSSVRRETETTESLSLFAHAQCQFIANETEG